MLGIKNANYYKILKKEHLILGIDPGTTVMGYGLISIEGNQLKLLLMDELILNKYDSHYLRLKKIFERTTQIIDEFHPDELAIEAPFYGKNVQSMLKLGRAQGVAMAAGLQREIPITEYLPKKVKMAVVGNGNASKEQVAAMLQRLLNIKTLPTKLDATDGLAVAVCHYFNSGNKTSEKKYGSWKSFISNNPGKISK